MAESHVISALTTRQQNTKRLITLLKKRLATATTELETIDAALRIFKSDADPSTPLIERPKFASFNGESLSALFGTLRAAAAPVTTWHLTQLVMQERGLALDDPRLCRKMEQRVRASLNYYRRKRGILRSVREPDGLLLWEIVGRGR